MVREMPTVEFHFDFGSPNAYLAHKVIPAIERRTHVKFEYVPVLLGGVFKLTNNRSPVESFAGVKNKLEYQQLEMRRFIAKHGIERFRFNPHFPVNTLQIMRGAVVAQTLGVYVRYVEDVFRYVWEEEKKMDDAEVLATALAASGFSVARFFEEMQSPTVKEQLQTNTARSVGRGTFGSPTFFVGDDMYFGKDRLRDVEEAILAKQ
jgi:2-hydroxychromene-2-carboxylate isomerase